MEETITMKRMLTIVIIILLLLVGFSCIPLSASGMTKADLIEAIYKKKAGEPPTKKDVVEITEPVVEKINDSKKKASGGGKSKTIYAAQLIGQDGAPHYRVLDAVTNRDYVFKPSPVMRTLCKYAGEKPQDLFPSGPAKGAAVPKANPTISVIIMTQVIETSAGRELHFNYVIVAEKPESGTGLDVKAISEIDRNAMQIKGMSRERFIVLWEDTPRGIVLEFLD
jgi:hypothetical protein